MPRVPTGSRCGQCPPPSSSPSRLATASSRTGAGPARVRATSSRSARRTSTSSPPKGQQVYLDVRECASGGSLVWTLQRPDDEPVFENETMCSGDTRGNHEDVELPQAGSYTLTVSGSDAATGTYRVTLWPVPAPQQFSLAIGDTIAPDQAPPGCGQHRAAKSTGQLHLHRQRGLASQLGRHGVHLRRHPGVDLRRPDDEPVFEDESMCSGDSPSDQEDVTLPQAGDYRLIVSGSEASTGTYRVKTQKRWTRRP